MAPDDRRPPFRSGGFDNGRGGRPSGPEHGGDRSQGDRPGFGNAAARPFTRPVTRGGDLPAPPHSVRLRDGDRELEVVGAPAFVRQILDDLPALLGRLRGEIPGRSAISMPPAPAALVEAAGATAGAVDRATEGSAAPAAAPVGAGPRANGASAAGTTAHGGAAEAALEAQVFAVLRDSDRPLPVAAIRSQLRAGVSGQQVRRLLERAATRVHASADKPATYSLR